MNLTAVQSYISSSYLSDHQGRVPYTSMSTVIVQLSYGARKEQAEYWSVPNLKQEAEALPTQFSAEHFAARTLAVLVTRLEVVHAQQKPWLKAYLLPEGSYCQPQVGEGEAAESMQENISEGITYSYASQKKLYYFHHGKPYLLILKLINELSHCLADGHHDWVGHRFVERSCGRGDIRVQCLRDVEQLQCLCIGYLKTLHKV